MRDGAIILDRPLQLGPNRPRVAVDFDDLDELPQALRDLDARAAETFNR